MKIRFLAQPFAGRGQVGRELSKALSSARRFRATVAWAQVSGLDHLEVAIDALRRRGGTAEAIIGIDQGIATIDGLKAAMRVFEPVYVFHDRGRRTFHPKLYIAEGNRAATVLIGSPNLTEGGLFRGYETAIAISLDLSRRRERLFLRDASRYFDLLIECGRPCRRLDNNLLALLASDPRLTKTRKQVAREQKRARKFEDALSGLFGAPLSGLAKAPKPTKSSSARHRGRRRRGYVSSRPGRTTGRIMATWSKRLTPSDAMRKPPGSHERRYAILSRARHAINSRTFFRRVMFGDAKWSKSAMRTGRPKETALIRFEVFVERRYLGQFDLVVDHAPSRVSKQRNSPTWLNWSSLAHVVRANDFRGQYLLLEKLTRGRFRLTITRNQPGV